jgi:hypothetical protein
MGQRRRRPTLRKQRRVGVASHSMKVVPLLINHLDQLRSSQVYTRSSLLSGWPMQFPRMWHKTDSLIGQGKAARS